mgnify:CR=1 FL=1|jgi:glutamate racemase
MKVTYPIGVFDSGLGGLNVLKEMRLMLPNEDFVYLADNLNCPYGTKTETEILRLVGKVIDFFKRLSVKVIVLACNTTSAYLDLIRLRTEIPIIGVIVPTVKAALKASKKKNLAVLATNATVESGVYQKLLYSKIRRKSKKLHFIRCSEFVEAIEAGEVGTDYSRHLVYEKLSSLKECNLDTVVLACTHFDLYQDEIQIVFPEAKLITSGVATAKTLKKLLKKLNLKNQNQKGEVKLLMTGELESFRNRADWILNRQSFEKINLE